jgi:hypothetical protein
MVHFQLRRLQQSDTQPLYLSYFLLRNEQSQQLLKALLRLRRGGEADALRLPRYRASI